ncbi:MAG: hypothetical protein QXF12_05325 [Candidatus Aenigmatarchaeota archaeon]
MQEEALISNQENRLLDVGKYLDYMNTLMLLYIYYSFSKKFSARLFEELNLKSEIESDGEIDSLSDFAIYSELMLFVNNGKKEE